MTTYYKRAHTRPVDRIRHMYWKSNHEPLCGCRPHEYNPAPARFLKGDFKPEVVEVSCPICHAMAIVYEAERRMSNNNTDKKEGAR